MGANLTHKLHEPHYWDGPDALNLLDLKVSHSEPIPLEAETTVDSPRLFPQLGTSSPLGQSREATARSEGESGDRGSGYVRTVLNEFVL